MVVQEVFQKMNKSTLMVTLFMAFHIISTVHLQHYNTTTLYNTTAEVPTCPDKCRCRPGDVDCRSAGFTRIPQGIPKGTRRLYLDNNRLRYIYSGSFSGLNELVLIYLTNTSLTSIPENVFTGLVKLERLYLRDNALTSVKKNTFSGLSKLITLDLRNNSLTRIQKNSFAELVSLQHLSLRVNALTSIKQTTFSGLSNLKTLDLRNNLISSFHENSFSELVNLEILYLGGNQMLCTCDYIDMLKLMTSTKTSADCISGRDVRNFLDISCPHFTNPTVLPTKVVARINGKWGTWQPWDRCSGDCGSSYRSRTRLCNKPPPSGGGSECFLSKGQTATSDKQTENCKCSVKTKCQEEASRQTTQTQTQQTQQQTQQQIQQQTQQQSVQQTITNVQQNNLVASYVPQCTNVGLYNNIQCHRATSSTTSCWCVESNSGEETPGTRLSVGKDHVNPNCKTVPPHYTAKLPSAEEVKSDSFQVLLIKFDDNDESIKHYDVIVSNRGNLHSAPSTSPSSYTNTEIKNNKDGLYVAKRVYDKNLFGTRVTIGKESSRRDRRNLGNPINKEVEENTKYAVFVRGYVNEDTFQSSPWYPIITTKTKAVVPTPKQDSKSGLETWIIIVAVVAAVAVISVVIAITTCCYLCRKRQDSTRADVINTVQVPSGQPGIRNPAFQVEGKVEGKVYEDSLKRQMTIYEEIGNGLSDPTYDAVDFSENTTSATGPPLGPRPLGPRPLGPTYDQVHFSKMSNVTVNVSGSDLYEQPTFKEDDQYKHVGITPPRTPLPAKQQSPCPQSPPDDNYDNNMILQNNEQSKEITEPEYLVTEEDYTELPKNDDYTTATYQTLSL